jgi:DNA-binding response OmpR family regulator
MAKRILLVDDEPLILKGLKFSLEQDGYETDSAEDGEAALEKLQKGSYDLVLLDVMLPKMSGIEVCQAVREKSDVPIIMLTAKGQDMDKILGLEYGADDYMIKPFNVLEVKARIKNILRRAGAKNDPVRLVLSGGDLTLNLGNRAVTVRGEPVNLTVKEFDLLNLFLSNPGKVYSRDALLETIWGFDYIGDFRTVDVHIRRLREKIEQNPASPSHILTKWGVGYYFAQQ